MLRRPKLIRAPALIYFAHPLDPALIQGNTVLFFIAIHYNTFKISNISCGFEV